MALFSYTFLSEIGKSCLSGFLLIIINFDTEIVMEEFSSVRNIFREPVISDIN